MPKTIAIAVLSSMMVASGAAMAPAETVTRTELKPFNVTVRVFDPMKGVATGQDYVLPVDSPDAEHAAASTMANAVAFTQKTEAGRPLPVAFTCVKVEPRWTRRLERRTRSRPLVRRQTGDGPLRAATRDCVAGLN